MAAQLCQTFCDPMHCCLPGFSAHGISQARTLEWVAISLSRGPSGPRDRTHISCVSSTGRWTPYHKHYLGSTSPPPNISLCFFLAAQRGLWDLSSLNRYGSSAPSSGSTVLTTGPPVNSRGRISDAVYYPWILESSKGTGIHFVSLLGHHT